MRWRLGAWFSPALAVALGWPASARARADEAFVWPTTIARLERALASDDPDLRRQAAVDLERLPREVQLRILPGLMSDPDPEIRLLAANAALGVRLPSAGERAVQWLNHADARVRESAARVLAALPHAAAVPALGRVLGDPEPRVRAAAARALGASRSERGTSFLLGHLDDTDPTVREAVISALEELGDARAVVPLIGRIQDQRAEIRARAARALGALADERAAGALTVALGDADAKVRAAAARALGRAKSADATWSLRALLSRETDPAVQEAIVDALGEIGTAASCSAIVQVLPHPHVPRERARRALVHAGAVAIPALRECLFQQAEPGPAEVCVSALGEIGGEVAGEHVLSALRQGAVSAPVALVALGRVGDARSLPNVLEFLSSPQPDERRAAVDAARALMRPGSTLGLAVEPIVAALEQSRGSRLEQAALIGLLGETRSPRAAEALLPLARSNDAFRRTMAVEALGRLGPSGSDEVLVQALAADDFATRWSAAVALRKVATRDSLEPLLTRLEAGAPRDATLYATALAGPLAHGADAAQVERVVSRLQASSGALRDLLIDALSRLPAAQGSTPLVEIAAGAGVATRAKVAEVLAGHPEALPALRRLARDTRGSVRANAVWALGHVGKLEDLPFLRESIADRDVAVSGNAVGALVRISRRLDVASDDALCGALGSRRSYVVVNALVGLASLGGECTGSVAPAWLLSHHPSEEVRLAAARLLRRRPEWAPAGDPLGRCARRDRSGRVAAVCRDAPAPPAATGLPLGWVSVMVHRDGQSQPMPRAPYSLVLPDGLIRSGLADRSGSVAEGDVVAGELRLVHPAPFAD